MRIIWPFLALYRRHWILLTLGILLSVITLLASIGLLTLSGWFLAGTAIAGIPGAQTFNYLLPAAGVRGAAIARTVARYAERVIVMTEGKIVADAPPRQVFSCDEILKAASLRPPAALQLSRRLYGGCALAVEEVVRHVQQAGVGSNAG